MSRLLLFFRPLLLPLGWLYASIMAVRNFLYDKGLKESHRFPLPVICVGNLSVGGTGKTPHTEYLIRLLQKQYPVATLSRGYGRKTKGFIIADTTSTAERIGDEPLQLYQKFSPGVMVAVGEKRAAAIPRIVAAKPETQVILLDDAYQHRSVKPSFSILLTDYNRPFYQDYVLPAGRLRENRSGAHRADVVIVTKCPADLSGAQQAQITRQVRRYAATHTPVFFTGIRYGAPVAFGNTTTLDDTVMLVTGLANAVPLEAYISQKFTLLKHLAFPDHYQYQPADLSRIETEFIRSGARALVTTEKDYVRYRLPGLAEVTKRLPFFYIPIEVYFLTGQAAFNHKVITHCHAFRDDAVTTSISNRAT